MVASSRVGCNCKCKMMKLFKVANAGFNISQDLFISHKFQGVCFYFSSFFLLKFAKTTHHFQMNFV